MYLIPSVQSCKQIAQYYGLRTPGGLRTKRIEVFSRLVADIVIQSLKS